jgi:hypothetical protein
VAPKLPSKTRIKVQEVASVQEEIVLEEFPYRQHLRSILGELEAIGESIERLFSRPAHAPADEDQEAVRLQRPRCKSVAGTAPRG